MASSSRMTRCPYCGRAPTRCRSHAASKRDNNIEKELPMTLEQPPTSSPTRRAFLYRSAVALSASPFALAVPGDARSMSASDTDALRRGIDEANRRFEDGFNRGDPASAARQFYTRDARI